MKKLIISLIILFSSFFMFNDNKVFALNGNFIDYGVQVDVNFTPNNEIGDIYTFDINETYFKNKIEIKYKSSGLYLVVNNNETLVYDSSVDYLHYTWVLIYYENASNSYFYLNIFNRANKQLYVGSSNSMLKFPKSHSTGYFRETVNSSRKDYQINTDGSVSYQGINSSTYKIWPSGYIYGTNTGLDFWYNNTYNDITSSKVNIPENPTINFTYTNNYSTINDEQVITSQNVFATINNYDPEKYVVEWKLYYDENWITHTFRENENVLNVILIRNDTIQYRIWDIEAREIIYTNSFTTEMIYNKNSSINNDNDSQLYSIDFYTYTNENVNINREININYYNKNNDSKSSLNGFTCYGLKLENGLYHWEEITDNSCYVDYQNNNFIESINGFYFKGNIIYNNQNIYKQIKVAANINNGFNYEIETDGILNYFGKNYFRFETAKEISNGNCGKVLFSSYETTSNYIYIENPNNIHISFDYYDNTTKQFYGFLGIEYYKKLGGVNYYRSYYEKLGYSEKKGMYAITNDDEYEHYFIIHDINLYYSFDMNLGLGSIIDSDGNIIDSNIIDYDNTKFDNINDIFNIIDHNNNVNIINKIFTDVWNIFKSNGKIYTYLILIIATSIALLFIKAIGGK